MSEQDTINFKELMALRAGVYRVLGSVYFTELTTEQITELSKQDFKAFAELDPELAAGAKEIQRALRHVNSSTREELAVDYAHTFLAAGCAKGESCAVPYESVYTSDTGLLMGPSRQSVYRLMLKEGVLPDATLRTPEDHLSFECEFMATLSDRASASLEAGDFDETQRLVGLQQAFRVEHLANWINAFYDAVDCHCRTRFYRGIAMITKAFIRIDEELLNECACLVAELSSAAGVVETPPAAKPVQAHSDGTPCRPATLSYA